MLKLIQMTATARTCVEYGHPDAVLAYLFRTTGTRFIVEYQGERSLVMDADRAALYIARMFR